jgi:hypothetical protein
MPRLPWIFQEYDLLPESSEIDLSTYGTVRPVSEMDVKEIIEGTRLQRKDSL